MRHARKNSAKEEFRGLVNPLRLHRNPWGLLLPESGADFKIHPLPHDRALAEGVAIFSEGLVLGFSGLVIVVEFNRSALKSAASAAKAAQKEAEHEAEQDRQRTELEKRLTFLEDAVGKRALEREEEKAAAAAASKTKRGGIWSLFG